MQIILSRKGFDSANGGIPSPIMPDGTLLSLPIPYENDDMKFSNLTFDGKTYFEIIRELNSKTKKDNCHLDPDIRKCIKERENGWKPLFGQQDKAQSHLKNKKVNIGDLFLFFGWFKQTEKVNNQLIYQKDAPDLHLIYGYLQIGKIHDDISKLPSQFNYHPHAKIKKDKKINCIYESCDKLDFLSNIDGAACLKYNKNLVLTKNGCSRSKWELPDFFKQTKISYHSKKSWRHDYFQSSRRGQEFVVTPENNETKEQLKKWVYDLIKQSKTN